MEVFHLMLLIDTVYIFIQGDLGYRLTELQACRERRAWERGDLGHRVRDGAVGASCV
jgi:hypothetical protein